MRAAIDTLRGGNDTLRGRVLARNILLNLSCPTAEGSEGQRCAAMKLLATAAAISLDTGCTDAASCATVFREVVAADALRRLQEWGARNHITIPLPAQGQPFTVATLSTLPAPDLKTLKESAAFRSLVLWNEKATHLQQAITPLIVHITANKPAVPTLTAYVRLLESSLNILESNGVAPEQVALIRATLVRVDPRIYTAVDMALVTYRAAQSLRRGNNALAVVREAALETPCERDNVNDFTCGFRFSGVVLASIVFVEETLTQPIDLTKPADRKSFIDLAVKDLRKRLAAAENIGVEKWATDRFLAYQTDYAAFTETVLGPILTLEGSMKTLRELRKTGTATQDALDRASVQVVEDAFALLKTPFMTLPVDTCLRQQTVRVLDDVRLGWLGVQKKEYRDIITAIVSLGSDLGIESPIIDHIIAYRPLIEAFTAAETTEEFKASVENFIDAAPSAAELQQLGRASSLSMYVGGLAGAANGAGTIAPYVPVGLDLNFGRFGGMFSVVDIGAVAALYVKDGESKIPEARLSNVFSPGFLLRYGWTGKPYTWGASVSLVPGVDGSDDREIRAGLFIAYHRPLLRITPLARTVTTRPQMPRSPCPD